MIFTVSTLVNPHFAPAFLGKIVVIFSDDLTSKSKYDLKKLHSVKLTYHLPGSHPKKKLVFQPSILRSREGSAWTQKFVFFRVHVNNPFPEAFVDKGLQLLVASGV